MRSVLVLLFVWACGVTARIVHVDRPLHLGTHEAHANSSNSNRVVAEIHHEGSFLETFEDDVELVEGRGHAHAGLFAERQNCIMMLGILLIQCLCGKGLQDCLGQKPQL